MTPAAAPLPPRIPDHELIRRIGRGAYGEVWLAKSVTGAFRAVKIVHRASFDHDRPFEREFEGILQFEPVSRRHDSQVDILHVGRTNDSFYYVMELADDQATGGQIQPDDYHPRTLKSDLLFHGRLSFEECVRIGIALATALDHLHASGLVHRDVKPSNIIFVNGVPKLADIGLVTGVDATHSLVGTEGFAAPEGPGTPTADLYSLGKVLYEMSTGKDRQEFPDLPTQLRELPDREGLIELNAVIVRACRHDPKDRYATAAAMRADLELLQSGKSLARLHRTEARLRWVQRAGALATVLSMLIAGGWLWQARQTEQVRKLVAEKGRLAEMNRERNVRLDVANGSRLMDEGDSSAALLWYADALSKLTNNPAEETIHRMRIQALLNHSSLLLVAVPGLNRPSAVSWSPDGGSFVCVSDSESEGHVYRHLQRRDTAEGREIWRTDLGSFAWLGQTRFTRDGNSVLINSPSDRHYWAWEPYLKGVAMALDAATGRPIYSFVGSNYVRTAFSPDDRWLALALTNHSIRVVDAKNGTPVLELAGHTNSIQTLCFSEDGSLLASASLDHTVRLWRLPSGESAGAPFVHEEPVRNVGLSGDGRWLVTATEPKERTNCSIQFWDSKTGQRLSEPIRDSDSVYATFFCGESGDRLFVGSKEASQYMMRVWETRSFPWSLVAKIDGPDEIRCWDSNMDGTAIAIGYAGGWADVYSISTGAVRVARTHQPGIVESIRLSQDGTRLLAARKDKATISSLKARNQSAVLHLSKRLSRESAEVPRLWGEKSGRMVLRLGGRAVHIVNSDPLEEEFLLKPHLPDRRITGLATGSSGRFWALSQSSDTNEYAKTDRIPLASLRQPTEVVLWSKEADGFEHRVLQHPQNIILTAFHPDDSKLYTFCFDWAIRIWRTSDGQLEQTIPLPKDSAYFPLNLGDAWFSPDRLTFLLLLEKGKYVQRFDLHRKEFVGRPFPWSEFGRAADLIQFSPDGQRLAMVSGRHCYIADLQTGHLAKPEVEHPWGKISSAQWSPKGEYLLTAGFIRDIYVWNASTGEQQLAPLPTGKATTRVARWSPDGRFIVTRNDDGYARVWDGSTGDPVTPALRHDGYIRWACLSPSNRLITASDPNLLRAWDLKPITLPSEVISDYAKLVSGRRLNEAGILLPLRVDEMILLEQSLRSRAPELFARD